MNDTSIIIQIADFSTVAADIGSLTLEFTRLSQLTGDPKWYDAMSRIIAVFEAQQNMTNLPGLWPTNVNARIQNFHEGGQFAVGALSDSVYEYLLKLMALLGGSAMYEKMYSMAVDAIIRYIIFRPMVADEADILFADKASKFEMGQLAHRSETEHLACFIGGLLAPGGRMMDNKTHIDIGRKLTDGCIWAYDALPLGIRPEDMSLIACGSRASCPWNESEWHAVLARQTPGFGPATSPTDPSQAQNIIETQDLPPGITSLTNKYYILRPEAIESVFVLYRITGDPQLRDDAWRMFTNIQNATMTDIANSALSDETESFWLAETLKYFYLISSELSLISSDEYMLNTEGHPLQRPRARSSWGWG